MEVNYVVTGVFQKIHKGGAVDSEPSYLSWTTRTEENSFRRLIARAYTWRYSCEIVQRKIAVSLVVWVQWRPDEPVNPHTTWNKSRNFGIVPEYRGGGWTLCNPSTRRQGD